MTENPTIQEAFEQAESSLTVSESSSDKTEDIQESQSVEAKPEGEAEHEDDQEQSHVESMETPLEKFDPEKLPPELKPLYKNLMKGFTEGRQKDREEVRQLKQELKELRAQQPQEEVPDPHRDPEGYANWLANKKISEQKVSEFRSTALSEYSKLDPRLDDTGDSYDIHMDAVIGAQLDKRLDDFLQEGGNEWEFDYKTEGKRLVKEWDEYLQTYAAKYLEKQKEMAKKHAEKINRSHPKSSSSEVKASGSLSLEEAAQQAYQKLGG